VRRTDRATPSGLRGVIGDGGPEVEKVAGNVRDPLHLGADSPTDTQTWNRRYRRYLDKIKTGSVYDVAEVMRDLNLRKHEKALSFGERKMLDTARSLLIQELAVSLSRDHDELQEEIEALFE
jgi:CarD family transcriptional regulator